MKKTCKIAAFTIACLTAILPTHAAQVFFDDFNAGPSPLWGNERGNWTAAGGSYYAQLPDNVPPTFSSLPFLLENFTVEFDLYGISDGGVWLRSDFEGANATGVLLVTGGWRRTGTGFYWHIVHNDSYSSPLNEHASLFAQGDNVHIRIEVSGDTYRTYLNNAPEPATTLITSQFKAGHVALYDFSAQTFDNITLTADQASPDLHFDGIINLIDFATLAAQWQDDNCQQSNTWCNQTDLNFSTATDLLDLAILANHWLETPTE